MRPFSSSVRSSSSLPLDVDSLSHLLTPARSSAAALHTLGAGERERGRGEGGREGEREGEREGGRERGEREGGRERGKKE